MEWIDVTAAVEARRHAHSDVTLAAVDALDFIAPVQMNDTIVLNAEVTWTGRTSLEVRVDTDVEHLDGRRQLVNRAYLVFVAVDADGKPQLVESFKPSTPDECREWQQAVERRRRRLEQRAFMTAQKSDSCQSGL